VNLQGGGACMYVYVNLSMYECISGAGEPAGGRRGDGAYYQRCRSDGVRNGCGENMRKEEKKIVFSLLSAMQE